MFVRCAIKIGRVIATRVVLLLVLPSPVVCQGLPSVAEEPSGTIEEVIVIGQKPLIKLKHEMYRAEEALYDTFNSFNTDEGFKIRCRKEAITGSKIKQRVCRPDFVGDLLAEATQRMMWGQGYIYPAAQIKKGNERLLAKMTETALEQPEMLNALVKYTEARKTLESERKRRCTGWFKFCR